MLSLLNEDAPLVFHLTGHILGVERMVEILSTSSHEFAEVRVRNINDLAGYPPEVPVEDFHYGVSLAIRQSLPLSRSQRIVYIFADPARELDRDLKDWVQIRIEMSSETSGTLVFLSQLMWHLPVGLGGLGRQ